MKAERPHVLIKLACISTRWHKFAEYEGLSLPLGHLGDSGSAQTATARARSRPRAIDPLRMVIAVADMRFPPRLRIKSVVHVHYTIQTAHLAIFLQQVHPAISRRPRNMR